MDTEIKPDPKFNTKCRWILLATSATLIIIAAIIHLIISLSSGNMQAITIIWIVFIGVTMLMWLISYPIINLWIKNLTYLIYEDRITIHQGIITKTQKNIPFRAITDFVLERTLFDRILGIGAIKVQTAGQAVTASGYEGKLSGLIAYEALHADLREKIKNLHPRAESVTTKEPLLNDNILSQILAELKEIRKSLQK